jgi:predicted nucleic acid-binding protein
MMAEGLFTGRVGHDYAVNRLLREVDAVDVDQRLGLAAGALRQEAMRAGPDDPPPSGVDAIVAALADSRASADSVRILTSDLEDLQLLASLGANADRVSVLAV